MMIVKLEDDETGEAFRGLIDGIKAFNRQAVPDMQSKSLTVVVRDEHGALHGGVVGRIAADSMYVEVVWNDDVVRGTGMGRKAMLMLEDEARKHGVSESWLYTMSFQAKPFYEKLGYSQFAELPWNNGRHARFFMRKDL